MLGYPMKLVERRRFTDIVSGKAVNLYESKGKMYLAESRWSLFRVEKKIEDSQE